MRERAARVASARERQLAIAGWRMNILKARSDSQQGESSTSVSLPGRFRNVVLAI